ncbi:hypothetical protein Vafri_12314, partial [Volvox africanus]
AALLARFAPEVQPRDVEARNALASGSYRMRSNETVPSYQSRFEALVTPIADLSEGDRIFWFQRGLSEALAGECAIDLMGRKFQSYVDLVRFAHGAEMRILAKQGANRPAPRVHAMRLQDPTLDAEADDQETATDRRGPKAAAAAVRTDRGCGARGTSGAGRQRRSSGAGQSTDPVRGKRKGDSPSAAVVHKTGNGTKRQRTDDNWLSKWGCTRSELECRRRKGVCLRCASDHVTRECPLLPAYTPKLDK